MPLGRCRWSRTSPSPRSEEHTSELQSQSNLVCRLLLEKKKKTYTKSTNDYVTFSVSPRVDRRSRLHKRDASSIDPSSADRTLPDRLPTLTRVSREDVDT